MSEDEEFLDPQLAINRVYTRKGDAGDTRLVGGQKVRKDATRIEAYGTVDELNAFVGAAVVAAEEDAETFESLLAILARVQHELFNLGSILATLPEDVGPKMPRIRQKDVDALEASIDQFNENLPGLRSFVLPGGSPLCVALHQCRTISRRAERRVITLAATDDVDPLCIAYLNRLSDAFFVWSRHALVAAGRDEVLWDPNLG